MKSRLLIVDDEKSICKLLRELLRQSGYDAAAVSSFDGAVSAIQNQGYDLIISDIKLGPRTGIDLLRIVRKHSPRTPVVMLTGYPTIENAAESVRYGAFDYLVKPVEKEKLLRVVALGLRHKAALDREAEAERSLEKSRIELETVFQSIPEGILTVDEKLTVIRKNRHMDKICPNAALMQPGTRLSRVRMQQAGCAGECIKILEHTINFRKSVREYHLDCDAATPPLRLVLTCTRMGGQGNTDGDTLLVIRDISRIRDLEEKLREQESEREIIGKSEKMRHIQTLIGMLTDLDNTVLITGESGTGKELVMEALHRAGSRASGPLIRVNCAALPEHLLQSELFGHVRGAFTGAVKDRVGRFQAADGGTLFLDEIGDLPLHIQLKLLRVLERKEYERVGENSTRKADVRIIAATHLDLMEQVKKGLFREDFYYRLNVMNIHLPPLRERREDIPMLVSSFCDRFSQSFKKRFSGVTMAVMELFMRYPWPGNIRELKHVMEHACILCPGGTIGREFLGAGFGFDGPDAPASEIHSESGTDSKAEILGLLRRTDGNKAKAARLLGISRSTLYRRMRELGIS